MLRTTATRAMALIVFLAIASICFGRTLVERADVGFASATEEGSVQPVPPNTPVYLMSTFDGSKQDGLRFAYSLDGYLWKRAPGLFLRPEVGNKIMRDPSICQGPDGTWHLVWTTGWKGTNGIGYAHSKDLVHWSSQQYIPVMEHEPNVCNVWAPELFYDDQGKQFIICWASTIPGRFPDYLESATNNHRMYYTMTRDFTAFTPTQLFMEPDFSVIDCYLLQAGGRYVVLLKDNTRPHRNLRVAFGDTPLGPWQNMSPPLTAQFTEGPSALRIGEDWLIYYEHYREKQYRALKTRDFKSFTNITSEMTFPRELKHGTVFAATQKDLDCLMAFSQPKDTPQAQGLTSATATTGNANVFQRPRIINTTDLGADPDDEQSMVRFLVCSNEFDTEGLIVATGCWKKTQSSTGMLDKIVDAYAQVYDNLKNHADGYPTPDYLKSISVMGQRGYGMGDVGDGKDSPGSEMIIATVDKDDPRPVWIGGWGGVNNVAQAIWKVRETRSPTQLENFIGKLRVFDILGQDDAGAWLAKNFPDLFYIRATGVYGWQPSKNDPYLRTHIQSHGPLGAVYPDTKWATEGDTPAFMHVYPNGLNDPDQIDQGGWGGRFSFTKQEGIRSMSEVKKIRADGETRYDPYFMYGNTPEKAGAIKRWSKGYNNDFEARMDWTLTPDYSKANHHPVAVVNGDTTRQVLEVSASSGSSVTLSAAGSRDPDGDSLSSSWTFYNEPSSYSGAVSIRGNTSSSATVSVPADAGGKNIHIILTLHDTGTPNLYAYRRVIIKVN